MPPFTIGIRTFPRKADALAEVRRILHYWQIDELIRGDDFVLLRCLFDMHPRRSEAAKRGVTGFMVRLNDFHGTLSRGFHVVHYDGSTSGFSYRPCMNPDSDEPSVFAAMRAAIMLGQRRIMMEQFAGRDAMPCPTCRRPITRRDAHVHHLPPHRFRDIAKAYIAIHGEPQVVHSASSFGDSFSDLSRQHHWVEFHDARANRLVVCAACNFAAERQTTDIAAE